MDTCCPVEIKPNISNLVEWKARGRIQPTSVLVLKWAEGRSLTTAVFLFILLRWIGEKWMGPLHSHPSPSGCNGTTAMPFTKFSVRAVVSLVLLMWSKLGQVHKVMYEKKCQVWWSMPIISELGGARRSTVWLQPSLHSKDKAILNYIEILSQTGQWQEI